jgi:hypothetical protein
VPEGMLREHPLQRTTEVLGDGMAGMETSIGEQKANKSTDSMGPHWASARPLPSEEPKLSSKPCAFSDQGWP